MLNPVLPASFLALTLATAAAPEDLAKRYPATMSRSEQGLDWRCTSGDVWELKSFELEFGGQDFAIACGKGTVCLGVHGTNVVWAVVFPEKPGTLRAKHLRGDGEEVHSILLRFAPAELGRILPSKTVGGPGAAWLRARADRLFRRKIGHDWFTPAGNPTIVPAGITLVDVETAGGARRFYELDGGAGKIQYVAEFESQTLPPLASIAKADAEQVFQETWEAFDKEYANFILLPELDWEKLGKAYKKQALRAETVFDLAAVLSDMLASLEDLHVWVKAGDDWLPGYSRERPLNGSREGSLAQLASSTEAGDDLTYGRTEDGIGYLNVSGLGDEKLPGQVDAALEELADCWAMVVDLRFNGGGGEDLAQAIAGRFNDQVRIYSKNRYRSGPDHDDLGPVLERSFEPKGPWRYESPVIALWGQKTMSSAESMALMLAQCPQVTTMGDRTAGSSANPRRLEYPCGITVNLPRWHDMDPEGKPVEHAGILPEVRLDLPAEEFTATEDPVLEAALERLRKTPKGARQPGKR